MKISKWMVERHLQTVTAYVGDNDGAPEDLAEYDEDILIMKRKAERKGDLCYLRIAIDYLITHPEADAPSLMDMFYFYDEEEANELLKYIRLKVWETDEANNPEEIEEVELVDTSLDEWRQTRELYTPSQASQEETKKQDDTSDEQSSQSDAHKALELQQKLESKKQELAKVERIIAHLIDRINNLSGGKLTAAISFSNASALKANELKQDLRKQKLLKQKLEKAIAKLEENNK